MYQKLVCLSLLVCLLAIGSTAQIIRSGAGDATKDETIDGKHFRIVVVPVTPWVIPAPELNPPYKGFAIDLIQEVMKKVGNVTWSFQSTSDGLRVGSPTQLPTGKVTWDGAIGDLVNGRADIGVGAFTVTYDRLKAVDITTSIMGGGLRILIAKPDATRNWAPFLMPYQANLWFTILATVTSIGCVPYFFDKVSPFGARARDRGNKGARFTFGPSMYHMFMASLQQGVKPARAWSTRVVIVIYAFMVLILAVTYTSNLAALLTDRLKYYPITSVDDIRVQRKPFAVLNGSSVEDFFKHSTDTKIQVLRRKMKTYATIDACLNATLDPSNEIVAFIHDAAIVDYLARVEPCNKWAVGKLFGKEDYSFFLPQNSTDRLIFSQVITKLRYDGIVDDLYQKYYNDGTCDAEPPAISTRVQVQDFYGLWVVAIVFTGVGFIILGIETLVWRSRHRHDKSVPYSYLLHFCGYYKIKIERGLKIQDRDRGSGIPLLDQ